MLFPPDFFIYSTQAFLSRIQGCVFLYGSVNYRNGRNSDSVKVVQNSDLKIVQSLNLFLPQGSLLSGFLAAFSTLALHFFASMRGFERQIGLMICKAASRREWEQLRKKLICTSVARLYL